MPFNFGQGQGGGKRGRRFRGGRGAGGFRFNVPPGNCICPDCGFELPAGPLIGLKFWRSHFRRFWDRIHSVHLN